MLLGISPELIRFFFFWGGGRGERGRGLLEKVAPPKYLQIGPVWKWLSTGSKAADSSA